MYLRAHALHLSSGGDPDWTTLLDFHFQHGTVISRPDLFLLARPVIFDWPDDDHASLTHVPSHLVPDCWHIWLTVGHLDTILTLAHENHLPFVTWQRRRHRLHRYRLLSHDEAQSTTTPAGRPAARLRHWSRP
jgi:hypothetical protein